LLRQLVVVEPIAVAYGAVEESGTVNLDVDEQRGDAAGGCSWWPVWLRGCGQAASEAGCVERGAAAALLSEDRSVSFISEGEEAVAAGVGVVDWRWPCLRGGGMLRC
jgi:hypothetical protein